MLSLTATSLSSFPSKIPRAFPCGRSPVVIRSSSDNGNNNISDLNASPPTMTPPDAVEIRFRRGSRKRRTIKEKEAASVAKDKDKDWDSMTLGEKAVEVYMGEKGLLFWVNKLAYASIFIVIGGWILFRFVGPALNLYQLDTPPISPASIFKGS